MPSRRRILQILALSPLYGLGAKTLDLNMHSHERLIGCSRDARAHRYTAINLKGELCYSHPLPQRGHEVFTHQYVGVVVARAPGQFLQWFHAQSGKPLKQTRAPTGTTFSGHGTHWRGLWWFGLDTPTGAALIAYTTQATIPTKIVPLHGIGVHQLLVGPNNTLYVAMGGWLRKKGQVINHDSFHSNLLAINKQANNVLWQSPKGFSLRHLACNHKGLFIALQHVYGKSSNAPLIYFRPWDHVKFIPLLADDTSWRRCKGYIASISANAHGLVASSPRGHCLLHWPRIDAKAQLIHQGDVAALSASRNAFFSGSGFGELWTSQTQPLTNMPPIRWDNHWHYWSSS